MHSCWRGRIRARAALVIGANLVAFGLLAWLLARGGETRAGGQESAATPERVQLSPFGERGRGAATAPAEDTDSAPTTEPTPAPASPATRTRDRTVERRVATAAANAAARARKLSKGKVHAGNTTVAVHVREPGAPEDLVAIHSSRAMRPASNLKLITTATALVLLGPDWTFATAFEARGEVVDGTLRGELIARAGGDPLYDADGDGGVSEWVAALRRELTRAGIERIQGALVLDEGSFPAPAPGPEWPSEKEYWKEYAALSGGFSANAGCITANVDAGDVGGPARVRVRPRAHGLKRRGEVETGKKGSQLKLAVEARRHGLTVRGRVPAGTRGYATRFAHPDPVELFGHAVVAELVRQGVPVSGGFRRERGAPSGESIGRVTAPLERAVVPILRDSNNSVADQLFLAVGHAVAAKGDRDGGRAATARALEELGVPSRGLVQVDGSGLSRANRVTARQMTALLDAVLARGGERARVFRDALPESGSTGTLSARMRKGPARGRVRAKTGFIGGTSGLSGIVQTLDGRTLVFSILVEYPRYGGLNTSVWKPLQDEICTILVESRKSGT